MNFSCSCYQKKLYHIIKKILWLLFNRLDEALGSLGDLRRENWIFCAHQAIGWSHWISELCWSRRLEVSPAMMRPGRKVAWEQVPVPALLGHGGLLSGAYLETQEQAAPNKGVGPQWERDSSAAWYRAAGDTIKKGTWLMLLVTPALISTCGFLVGFLK